MRDSANRELAGNSPQIAELLEEIARVAASDAKVLITGESGVGKELVAHAIHRHSPRVTRPFVPVNCAGIPETLLESELFGHVKGSFTGAYRDKPGKLESADEGSIFLDEVSEMTLRMQGMLLRFLETGEVQKVGADRQSRRVNVRVIAATNRHLPDLVSQGQFREDLYYRLNVVALAVPPLRERRQDIPVLIDFFLNRFLSGNGHTVNRIDPDAMAALSEYHWPGNVRELENVIERLVVTGKQEVVTVEELPIEIRARRGVAFRPVRERRRTVTDELYDKVTKEQASFWSAVYPLYMGREITRGTVRDLVRKGLEESRGSYKIVCRLFNIESGDYKKFLNFLRKHDCQLPFKEFRR